MSKEIGRQLFNSMMKKRASRHQMSPLEYTKLFTKNNADFPVEKTRRVMKNFNRKMKKK